MLSYIFSGMIILSLVWSFINGTYSQTIETGLSSASDAVSLMLTLTASMGFFNGFLKIAEKSGLIRHASALFKKLLKPLFGEIKEESIFEVMSMNITANLFGMGNAASPFGIKAMEKMKKVSRKKDKATNSMCLFAVMNTASLQLIPSTVIAIRMKYESNMPYSIVFPVWISSVCGLTAGIIAAKLSERKSEL